jgi:glycerol-3-phosphate dehydrogenase
MNLFFILVFLSIIGGFMMVYDYIIIGSGIVGSLIARELSKYEVSVLVLEKESDIANGQSIANSAIIHSGHDPKENTLKAKLCVLGNKLYDDLEKELNISILRTSGMVVAKTIEDESMIDILYQRAISNHVFNPRIITKDEALSINKNLSPEVKKALLLPSTKVIYPWEVCIAAMENAIKNGVVFRSNSEVTNINYIDNEYHVIVNSNEIIKSKGLINVAGVHASKIAKMIEKNVEYEITPKKGEYLVLDKKVKGLFQSVIYPTPNIYGKGVLIVPQVHGNILLGPTSYEINRLDDLSTTNFGMNYIIDHLKNLTNKIDYKTVIRTFSGIRASSTYDDFYIKESLEFKRFYHVAGIDSPGLTSAPAISQYLIKEIIKDDLTPKSNFDPYLEKKIVFHELELKQMLSLLREKPKYGNIICNCEKVTEQEIIDSIHRNLGSNTIKGIKKRTRATSGLCQGGYCENKILKIISKELNIPLNEIDYYQKNSKILLKENK